MDGEKAGPLRCTGSGFALVLVPPTTPPAEIWVLASVGVYMGETADLARLADLSRIPSGTFFREIHPASEMGAWPKCTKMAFLLPKMTQITQKARFYRRAISEAI